MVTKEEVLIALDKRDQVWFVSETKDSFPIVQREWIEAVYINSDAEFTGKCVTRVRFHVTGFADFDPINLFKDKKEAETALLFLLKTKIARMKHSLSLMERQQILLMNSHFPEANRNPCDEIILKNNTMQTTNIVSTHVKLDMNNVEHRKEYDKLLYTGHPLMLVGEGHIDEIDNQIHSIAAMLLTKRFPRSKKIPRNDNQNGSEILSNIDPDNDLIISCNWNDEDFFEAEITVGKSDYDIMFAGCGAYFHVKSMKSFSLTGYERD